MSIHCWYNKSHHMKLWKKDLFLQVANPLMTKWSAGISSSQNCHMKWVLIQLLLQFFAHLQVTPNYLAPPAVSDNKRLCVAWGSWVTKSQTLNLLISRLMLLAVIICFSVMPSPVHVSVKTEGGLPQQTVARTVWLSSGTHSQRKTVTVIYCI